MTTDSQRNLMEMRDARLGVSVEDALAEIEALTAPADPEPNVVAEFARTPDARRVMKDVLAPEELAELDRELERCEALANIYQPEPAQLNPTLLELVRQTKAILHDDAKCNGRIAQRNREFSAHRKGAGRKARNASDRGDYASMIWETEGRQVRDYQKSTPERRREQKQASKKNRPPAQVERERIMDSARKAKKRATEKAARAAALKDAAIFS